MNQQPPGRSELRHRPSVVPRRLARGRYLVFAAVLAVSALALPQAWRTEFNFSVDAVYVFDDPELAFYRERVIPAFGASDNMVVVLVSGEPLFSEQALHGLQALHRALGAIEGVREVRSLVNARVPVDVDGVLELLPLFPGERAPAGEAAVAEVASRTRRASALKGRLVSDDLSTAVVVAMLVEEAQQQAVRAPIVERINAAVSALQVELGPGVALRPSGIPIISEAITDLLRRDQLTFIPGVLAVLGVLLWVAFRAGRYVLLPFLSTGVAVLWTLAVMRLEGHAINVTNNAIIPLLLVIGVGDAVYLLARFEEEVVRQREARVTVGRLKTVAVVTQKLGIPLLLNAVTTAIGFGSLITAKLVIIKEFGVDAAIGVILAYVVTMGVIPALLAMLPVPPPRRRDPLVRDLSDRLLSRLADFALGHRRAVIALTVAALAVSALGATRIRGHDRVLAELPEHHPVSQTLRFASDKLGGLVPYEIVIETPPGRAADPDVLEAVHAIQSFVRQQPDAPRMLSLIDVLGAVDEALRDPGAAPEPWTRERLAQLFLLAEFAPGAAEELAPYLSPQRDLMRIACFGNDVGTARVLALRDAVLRHAGEVLPAGTALRVTGPLVVTSGALAFVVRDMLSSLGLSFLVILALISLLFRSPIFGLLAILPNAVAIAIALGVMGYAGISLRPGTAIVFSMSLGIAVDAAIQWLSRFREERAQRELGDAITAAVRGTGRPILYSTVMLSLGLCVFLASDFVALRNLAVLGSTTFVTGMVVDLLLLPVLLAWIKPR